jgi:glycosyltransferase involved in cell wall biosynthesis
VTIDTSRLLPGTPKRISAISLQPQHHEPLKSSQTGVRPRISAFIIAQDEAEFIARCLESLRGLVDEILVIDGGSSDGTQTLATQHGARVIENAWPGFAEQKNFALSQCQHDWVLTLDADEEVSPELRQELEATYAQLDQLWAAENVGAWAMPRRVQYEGQWIHHGDWNPDYVTRLFRHEGAAYGGGLVHERIEHAGATRRLTSPLFHYTYRDRTDHLARIEKYSTLWARSKRSEGKHCGPVAPYARAVWRFLRGLVLKRGALDGKLGWRIAAFGAYEVFLKYQKLRALR